MTSLHQKLSYYILLFLLSVPPLIFFTDLTRNPYYFQIILVNSGTIVFWIAALYFALRNRRMTWVSSPIDLPLAVFFFVATISWVLAMADARHDPYFIFSAFSEGRKRWLFLIVNAILVYRMALVSVTDTNRNRFLHITFYAAIIASIYGVLQYFGIEFFWPKVLNPFGGRCVSTFGNPNFLSSYLILLMPVMYAYYVSSPKKGYAYLAGLLSCFAALLCTMTRSSWLGLFVGMMITLGGIFILERPFFKLNRSRLLLPFFLFGIIMVLWPKSPVSGYNPSVLERLTETKKAQDTFYGSWHQRRLIWSCAWHMAVEQPFFGKGWGCFELYFPSYQGRHLFLDMYRGFRTHANNTHNEILEIWSQPGIIGFGVYLWFLITLFASGVSIIRSTTPQKRLLALSLMASLVGMLADNTLNVSIHFAIPAFLYWWHIGLLMSIVPPVQRDISLNSLLPRGITIVVMLLGCITVIHYTRNFIAEMYYFIGFKYAKQNEVARAIPPLEKAHALQRFEVNNNYELANAYARGGQKDKAIEAYKESLRANAGYDEIYFNLATVMMQEGRIKEAMPEYSKALFINPLSFDAYAALGSICLQDPARFGDMGILLFEQCVFFFPDNKDIWNNLGFLYTKRARDKDAHIAYKKALALDPDFDLARKNLAITLQRLGTHDPEIEMIDRLFRTIDSLVNQHKWEEAHTYCAQLVAIIPKSFRARFYYANVLFSTRRFEDAVREYHEVLKLSPQNPAVLSNLGIAYLELKKYDSALSIFEQLLKADPANQSLQQRIAYIKELKYNQLNFVQ